MKALRFWVLSMFSKDNPHLLKNILWLAFFVRFVSVIFAKGFGMMDDHFLIIESSQSWVDGYDYNNWLPSSGATVPSGHSWFYPGFHYLLFTCCKFLGLNDPQLKMFIVRLIHALLSLLIVKYGFKIVRQITNIKIARNVGIFLALYWFMPWLSVRNLVEVACIPFMFWASWIYLNANENKHRWYLYFLSGIVFGIGINIRFQITFFLIGFGLGILVMKNWKGFLLWALGVGLMFGLFQGLTDFFIWHRPFAEFKEYVMYNVNNSTSYFVKGWYFYIPLIFGLLIPPLSFFIIYGYARSYRFSWPLFLGVLLFFLFHSYFPNKQERFILTIIPFIIMLGLMGWYELYYRSNFWSRKKILYKISFLLFWIFNLILLPVISTMYSKKARVESMYYLSRYHDIKYILFEDIYRDEPQLPPLYYLGQWPQVYYDSQSYPVDSLKKNMIEFNYVNEPRFVVFWDDKNIEARADSLKKLFPDLVYEKTCYPGFVDQLVYTLNPINKNETMVIYRNAKFFPTKKE